MNSDYDQLTLSITSQPFAGVAPAGTKPAYTFTRCRFMKIFIENNEDIPFERIDIDFIDCYVVDIEIRSLQTTNVSLMFLNCVLSGRLISSELHSVDMRNCIIRGSIFLKNISNININYAETNLDAKRWYAFITKNGLNRRALLRTQQKFYIYNPGKLTFITEEYNKTKPLYFQEQGPHARKMTSLTATEKKSMHIELYISMDDIKETTIKIKDSYLRSLSFNNDFKGNIIIEQTKSDSLYVRNFSIDGIISFYKLTPFSDSRKDMKMEIHQSKLSGVRFEKVDFKKYRPISFYRTNFEGCQFIACDFPEKPDDFSNIMALNNVHYENEKPENFYKDQYEIFIQIKSILDKTNNFHEGLKLNAMANEALRKTDDIGTWDKLVLWVNSWSNYHSLSVKRAFIGFVVSSVICYLCYLDSLDKIFTNEAFDWKLVGYYFSFIDITHKLEFMVEQKKFTTGSLIFDFIGKLFIGFYLYQFIAAFRKYGKGKS